MCFDGQTLSAFIDGELGQAQQSLVEEHLKLCSVCRKEADSIVTIKDQLKFSDHEVDLFTTEAVWTRLSHSTAPVRGLGFWHRGFILSPTLLVSLSFLFVAVLGVSLFFTISNNNSFLSSSISSDLSFESGKYPLEIPVDNVEKVLAYFNIHDEPLEFYMQLPIPSDFVIQGEPLFLKKTDYVAGR